MSISVRKADFSSASDGAALLQLLDAYAADVMGDGQPLAEDVKARLVREFAAFPTSVAFLAFADDGSPVGLATCFLGFSTFAARPLLNISDFYVRPSLRGIGIGRQVMEAVEAHARACGCCRLTLEVQEKNARARRLYEAAGFHQAIYTAEAGGSLYYMKPLVPAGPEAV